MNLDLFTRVEDTDLKPYNNYFVIFKFDNKEHQGIAYLDTWGSNEKLIWVVRGTFIGEEPIVTHVLDLSKLTTKEKAIEALYDIIQNEKSYTCYDSGISITNEAVDKFKKSL